MEGKPWPSLLNLDEGGCFTLVLNQSYRLDISEFGGKVYYDSPKNETLTPPNTC